MAIVLLAALATGRARAQDQDAVVQQMIELNRKALTAYGAKDYEGAKSSLLEAVVQGKAAGLADDRMMARTYLHLGAVYVEGLKDRPKGLRYFTMALRIRPDIRMTPSIASPGLTEAFEEAKRELQNGGPAVAPVVPAPAAAPPPPKPAPPPPREAATPAPEPAPAAEKAAGNESEEPDLPATIPQPLHCPSADEAPPGKDIFLRCVARPDLAVGRVLLFYRLPGDEKFTSAVMTRSRRGWWEGTIPAAGTTGKSVQYYFEARDATGQEVASNGRNDSPNLMLIREGAAPVGRGTLAGVRFASGAAPAGEEENPLEEQERARRGHAPGVHRRSAGSFWIGLGIGSGYGAHPASRLEFRTDLKVEAGVSSSGPLVLEPEIGYQVTESFGVSVQGRDQYIPQQSTGPDTAHPGSPAAGAHSALLRLSYFAGSGNAQLMISAIGGGGEGFRLVIPPRSTSDPKTNLPRNDTVRAGAGLAGAGLTFLYHLGVHVALTLDVKGLVGFPDSGQTVDAAVGAQVGF